MSGPSVSMPAMPQSRAFLTDPSKYKAFDTSGLSQSAIANSNQAGGNQIAQAKAQAAGMGGGRGSAIQNNVGAIQAGLGQNAQNIFNQNAMKSFEQQLGQMQNQNQFNLGQQGLENQLYMNQANLQQGAAKAPYENFANLAKGGKDAAALASLF
jgi:hypothetical protein